MSYIPTFDCWDGRFSDCFDQDDDEEMAPVDEDVMYRVCTPALQPGGHLIGTFSFVYS
jgi:hypothetical protein